MMCINRPAALFHAAKRMNGRSHHRGFEQQIPCGTTVMSRRRNLVRHIDFARETELVTRLPK